MLAPVPNWTVRGVIRAMLETFKRQPTALLLAVVVAPSAWSVPPDLLRDRLIPPDASASGTVPVWLDIVVLVGSMIWSSVPYGGQLWIAIDAVRGTPVQWRRYREGVRHTFRLALTGLPFAVPIGAAIHLPFDRWPDEWTVPLALGLLMLAIALAARTALWAPLAIETQRSLHGGLAASWTATRAQTWRISRLGLTLGAPLVPLCLVEIAVLGKCWIALSLLGGLYALADAHLYALIPTQPSAVAHGLSGAESASPSEADQDLPRVGSGWSKPFE
jgi:hypothetical protein